MRIAAYELIGEGWSIDDFRPDPDAAPVEMERPEQPGELIVTRTVERRIPLSIEQRLIARAEAADASVDELVFEWVTAESAAGDTISRDKNLALLAAGTAAQSDHRYDDGRGHRRGPCAVGWLLDPGSGTFYLSASPLHVTTA
ncbi:hypothetical protein ACWEQA_18835 [Nocardia sp. NPDC004085]